MTVRQRQESEAMARARLGAVLRNKFPLCSLFLGIDDEPTRDFVAHAPHDLSDAFDEIDRLRQQLTKCDQRGRELIERIKRWSR